MSEQSRKEGSGKFPMLLIITGAVFVSFLLSFLLGQSGIFRLQQLKAEYEQVQRQNFQLAMENEKVAKDIRKLRHDPATIEKIAREELHLASPHDVVLLVPEDKP